MRSKEERKERRAQRAERKAQKKLARFESFANRIAPQFVQMTHEERRQYIRENPQLFRGGGG